MAVSSLREVMDALSEQIEAAMASADVDVQVGARMIMNPSPPTIDMWPADPPVDQAIAGMGDIQGGDVVTVRARVDTNDHEGNQDVLLDLMDVESDMSVAAAIMDDPTLGGLAHLEVRGWTGLRPYTNADGTVLFVGAEWTVLALRVES